MSQPWTITDKTTGRFVRQFELISVICPCGVSFKASTVRIECGRGKFCSKVCMYKYRNAQIGEAHHRWKGDEAKYSAIHKWIAKEFGQNMQCEWCGFKSTNPYQIQWANLSGDYTRDREDWARLCAKCHWHFDREGTA